MLSVIPHQIIKDNTSLEALHIPTTRCGDMAILDYAYEDVNLHYTYLARLHRIGNLHVFQESYNGNHIELLSVGDHSLVKFFFRSRASNQQKFSSDDIERMCSSP